MRATPFGLFSRTFNPLDRKKYPWNAYPTPAINRIYHLRGNASALRCVKTFRHNIFYLAEWRTHLFFLLLIAYYRKNYFITTAPTTLQYGFGYGERIHAAHASLFPLLFDSANLRRSQIQKTRRSAIDHSFLSHWNNMTVPCPVISNQFDSFIEGNGRDSLFRSQLLFILNSCAMGCNDPLESMGYFFSIMQLAFKCRHVFIKNLKNTREVEAAKLVIQTQKKATFHFARADLYLKSKYIQEVLQWDKKNEKLETALMRTQRILLKGGETEAIAFLERYKLSSKMRGNGQNHMRDRRVTSGSTGAKKKSTPSPR